MGLTLADSYFLKAKGAANGFYTDWEEACEALNYALSYDENHKASLCLMGEIHAKHFSNYEKAFEYFDNYDIVSKASNISILSSFETLSKPQTIHFQFIFSLNMLLFFRSFFI